MAELRDERQRHAIAQDEHALAVREAQAALDAMPARRRAALVHEARGLGGEPHEELVAEEARLLADIAQQREKIEALSQVDRELAAEMLAIMDANVEHYIEKAGRSSEAVEAAEEEAERALSEARELRRASEDQWLVCFTSAQRREAPLPPHPPSPTLPELSSLKEVGQQPWPGGSRSAWQAWREHADRTQEAA